MLLLQIYLDNAITKTHVTRFIGSGCWHNLGNVLINILKWHLATINSTFLISGLEVDIFFPVYKKNTEMKR